MIRRAIEPECAQLAKSTENDNDSDDVVMQELLEGSWDLDAVSEEKKATRSPQSLSRRSSGG